ncbi:MAG: phosphoribosyltransferase [Ktedonobacteraceae bacterium]|nr:phosphoribosyltransferase [Ktedonobacteraceae bacterium]MBO0794448.1 phosphoribosyltransferase [Ktedonobacteraceae bacterium]
MNVHRFYDRREAGRLLATKLAAYAHRPDVLVLALPRGGVPVAFEIARELHTPLDVIVVRKLGVPRYEELAMGALATGGVRVFNREIIERLGVPDTIIEDVAEREQRELWRRERLCRGDRPVYDVHNCIVILVDDGIATGATMRAAVAAVRQQQPSHLIVAVPVVAPSVRAAFAAEGVELICILQPEAFMAVGSWYEDFAPTTDEEVRALLAQSLQAPGTAPIARGKHHHRG